MVICMHWQDGKNDKKTLQHQYKNPYKSRANDKNWNYVTVNHAASLRLGKHITLVIFLKYSYLGDIAPRVIVAQYTNK